MENIFLYGLIIFISSTFFVKLYNLKKCINYILKGNVLINKTQMINNEIICNFITVSLTANSIFTII